MASDSAETLLEILTSGNDQAAEQAAHSLIARGPASLPGLLALAHSAAADSRWWALRVLSEIPHPDAALQLAASLADPDPAVSQCAALGLRYQPTPAAIPALITHLAGPDALLARLAGDALAASGSAAVQPLIAVLENASQASRVQAARALAELRDPQAIPIFFKCIQEGDSAMVEYWADIGLQRLGVGMVFFNPGS